MIVLSAVDLVAPTGGNLVPSLICLGKNLRKIGGDMVFLFPKHENTIADNSWVHWIEREGFTVYLASPQLKSEQIAKQIEEIISHHGIDIIHVHFWMFHGPVTENAKRWGVKVLFHDHMDYQIEHRTIQKMRCIARSVRYRKQGVAVACCNRRKTRVFFCTKHWYVPNGLSYSRNTIKSLSREERRKEFGILPDERLCLLVCSSAYGKGLDIALKAVNLCRENSANLLLGIVGFGTEPAEEAQRFISERTGIDPRSPWIRYLPSTEDIFSYYRAADVFLSCSRRDSFPYAMLEAISQNVPAVASSIYGTRWSWKYSKCFHYPTESVCACANAIEKALAAGNAPSNRQDIMEQYSVENWCAQLLEIYAKL